jgi:DNA-binding CsgD family transcriptional regulator
VTFCTDPSAASELLFRFPARLDLIGRRLFRSGQATHGGQMTAQGFPSGRSSRSLAQIADALGIGYKTAANNCSQIRAKLRAETTADLVRIAIQHGLAD